MPSLPRIQRRRTRDATGGVARPADRRASEHSADEGYLFVVLHFPVYDKRARRLNAGELDIFLGPDYLVTLPNVELLPVTRLFARASEDEELRRRIFSKGSGRLLYEILDDLFD